MATDPNVRDAECVRFLQWALPRLRLRWAGYRKVRGQVRKRLARRLRELELADLAGYETYLSEHPDEWKRLDGLCRITISRFYRDRGVFDFLGRAVLPHLARAAGDRGVRCWSAGCASGEEPYTLALVWHCAEVPAGASISIVATDSDVHLLARASEGIYEASSLKDLPADWRRESFDQVGDGFRLRDAARGPVRFTRCDVREEMPDGPFDLILCRNLAFTYFEDTLQREVLSGMTDRLAKGGALVIGIHETVPAGDFELEAWNERAGIYRRA
jgi:chemotaxis protein methyltransferase CheR